MVFFPPGANEKLLEFFIVIEVEDSWRAFRDAGPMSTFCDPSNYNNIPKIIGILQYVPLTLSLYS